MRRKPLLILSIILVLSLWTSSCTYDYFEDETTYLVYVPELVDNSINDLKVLIYSDETGELVAEKTLNQPWSGNARYSIGHVPFKLPVGKYRVFIYTDLDGVTLTEEQHLSTVNFGLSSLSDSSDVVPIYSPPTNLRFETSLPEIVHPAIVVTDTVDWEEYTARITVEFKGLDQLGIDVSSFAKARLEATGTATLQNLHRWPATDRYTINDKVIYPEIPVSINDQGNVEVTARFYPSLDFSDSTLPKIDGETPVLHYVFYDANGDAIFEIPVAPVVPNSNPLQPISYSHGDHIRIVVEKYVIISVSPILDWESDIDSNDNPMQ